MVRILYAIAVLLFGHNSYAENKKLTFGKVVVEVDCNVGSSFESCDYKAIDEKSKKSFTLKELCNFATFLCAIPLPNEIFAEDAKDLCNALNSAVGRYRKEPDVSLAWLLDVYSSRDARTTKSDSPYRWQAQFQMRWTNAPIAVPDIYHVLLGAEQWQAVRKYVLDESIYEQNDLSSGKGWVIYTGQNHQRTKLEATQISRDESIHKTAHGVILQKNRKYAWVFISDSLTGGPPKLRLPSIVDAKINNELVFVLQDNHHFEERPEDRMNLIVVDVSKGLFGALNIMQLIEKNQNQEPNECPPVLDASAKKKLADGLFADWDLKGDALRVITTHEERTYCFKLPRSFLREGLIL